MAAGGGDCGYGECSEPEGEAGMLMTLSSSSSSGISSVGSRGGGGARNDVDRGECGLPVGEPAERVDKALGDEILPGSAAASWSAEAAYTRSGDLAERETERGEAAANGEGDAGDGEGMSEKGIGAVVPEARCCCTGMEEEQPMPFSNKVSDRFAT